MNYWLLKVHESCNGSLVFNINDFTLVRLKHLVVTFSEELIVAIQKDLSNWWKFVIFFCWRVKLNTFKKNLYEWLRLSIFWPSKRNRVYVKAVLVVFLPTNHQFQYCCSKIIYILKNKNLSFILLTFLMPTQNKWPFTSPYVINFLIAGFWREIIYLVNGCLSIFGSHYVLEANISMR